MIFTLTGAVLEQLPIYPLLPLAHTVSRVLIVKFAEILQAGYSTQPLLKIKLHLRNYF